MYYFDPMYFVFALPGILFALWASFYTKSTFARYSQVRSGRGLTGAQAAATMLAEQGVRDVVIEPVRGMLTDHYDPSSKTLRLSEQVYSSSSLAAVGVACHEAGHAMQDATNYTMLGLRSVLVPATNFGSRFSYIVFFLGLLLRSRPLLMVGVGLFFMAVLFAIVTLPVEWNATARAKKAMVVSGIVTEQERHEAAQVLNAAFLTYVASAVTAILTLLYYLLRSGLLGGRRD
ncbi:MAG: zinc metallopeptidase [Lentisphaerae bacterium]|jgi:uncharacterized protein|nr:zinc metallopeptidase [Lentisphaerota bacterium]MBT4821172.1 zinc metallopeptidase [Lentisphaerota bacterium]MBT5608766.1 zinc metallopeptidase [Lentisphaerota bacterium]MBT7058277.1 zinc metallopeptidase [Lentisphaerota bacterium]MBT7840252.1 zinc metallopeptidase [Lentisphaerota bacterium]